MFFYHKETKSQRLKGKNVALWLGFQALSKGMCNDNALRAILGEALDKAHASLDLSNPLCG